MKKILITTMLILSSSFAFASARISLSETQPQAARYSSFNFGYVPVGAYTYADFRVTAGNILPSRIFRISWSGPAYHLQTNCPVVLLPRQSCIVRVLFQPWARGFFNGQVQIAIDRNQYWIGLAGWGI